MFLDVPNREPLFMIQSKIPAIIGSNIPLVICANCIIKINFSPVAENITPKRITIPHTRLNFELFNSAFHPIHPQTTYAAASGAVIVLVIPAAKSPKERKCFAKEPNKGFKTNRKICGTF